MEIDEHLRKLDRLVDPAHVEEARELQRRALAFEEVERLPTLVNFPLNDWPVFPYKEAFYDPEKMLLNELAPVWVGALGRDDRMYTIRANHGVGIIPSIFGCGTRLMEENQMPWVEPLDDTELDRALSAGTPDLDKGLGGRVLDTERSFLDTISRFENLARTLRVFVCDIQGPFDLAHLVMGPRIYTEVLDRPERVHRLLDLVTQTFISFAKLQREIVGEAEGSHYHSQHYVQGSVRVCDDTPTNLSADMYREFCRPYDERVLKELGGGWVHYCGAAHQMLPEILSLPNLTGINFGNPEKQDARRMFEAAAERRVPVICWTRELPAGVKTGVTVARSVRSVEAALEITAG
jgi:uroporphyrinogen-III decarboxylase